MSHQQQTWMHDRKRLTTPWLTTVAALLGAVALCGCEFPPQIDTPQLNANADENLQTFVDSGSCVPGMYPGNVGSAGDKKFTRQCIVQGTVYIDGSPQGLLQLSHVQEVLGFIYLGGGVDLAVALPDLKKSSWINASGYTGTKLTAPAKLVAMMGLIVEKNGHLQSISGFDSVQTLQNLRLTANTKLTDVSGLSQITVLGGLHIENNPKLTQFSALANLTKTGTLLLKANPALANVPNFAALTQVDTELAVIDMKVAKLTSFSALTSVPTLKLQNMPNLTELAFAQLAAVNVLWFHQVPALQTLSGLPKLVVSKQVSMCVEGVPCAEVASFAAQHTPAVPQAQWTNCTGWVACKN